MASVFWAATGHLAYSLAHYQCSNEMSVLEKDGARSWDISCIAASRLMSLRAQLSTIVPRLSQVYIVPLVVGMGAFSPMKNAFCNSPRAKAMVEAYLTPYLYESYQEHASYFFTKIEKANYQILQHADLLVNIACCISYIALIAFGAPIQGGLGLVGMALLAVHRTRGLAPAAEQTLTYLGLVGGLLSDYSMPMNAFLRFICLGIDVYGLSTRISSQLFHRFHKTYPEIFHPSHGFHQYENPTLIDMLRTINDHQNIEFVVNRTHIFTNELEDIFPVDLLENLPDFGQLVTSIKQKAEGVAYDPRGLERIEKCAIKGFVDDQMPDNLPLFQKILAVLLQSILQDELGFAEKLYTLTKVGADNCVRGWARDISYILQPKTAKHKWAIHYELGTLRGSTLSEGLAKILPDTVQLFGGKNGVHLSDIFHIAYAHRFRTYIGELYMQMYPRSLIMNYLDRYLISQVTQPVSQITKSVPKFSSSPAPHFFISSEEKVLINFKSTQCGIGSNVFVMNYFPHLVKYMDSNYFQNPDHLLNYIYDMQKENKQGWRQISWEAIESWLTEKSVQEEKERGRQGLQEDDEFQGTLYNRENSPWFEQNPDDGTFHLSRQGVQLLLWDLGIIKPFVGTFRGKNLSNL